MTQEFVPYEHALALKELGFDEPCFGGYDMETLKLWIGYLNDGEQFNREYYYPAPTYSQAFRWFRNEHNLDSEVYMNHEYGVKFYSKLILKLEGSVVTHIPGPFEMYKSYEEAELACLRKLIEIVKNKES